MSIILGILVSAFIYFMPTIIAAYYKSSPAIFICIFILNLIAFFSFGLTYIIALIFAAISVGFFNFIKSILFATALVVLTAALGIFELSFLATMLGA